MSNILFADGSLRAQIVVILDDPDTSLSVLEGASALRITQKLSQCIRRLHDAVVFETMDISRLQRVVRRCPDARNSLGEPIGILRVRQKQVALRHSRGPHGGAGWPETQAWNREPAW